MPPSGHTIRKSSAVYPLDCQRDLSALVEQYIHLPCLWLDEVTDMYRLAVIET